MCGIAGILLAQREPRARRFAWKGRVAAIPQHRSPGGGGLVTGGAARPEISLAGDVDRFPTSAAYQPKVMS
jgi:hypothetical protein